ncbi:WecB/TagA/CpsF family glycosyltransferase [Kitasatospora arboriphila]
MRRRPDHGLHPAAGRPHRPPAGRRPGPGRLPGSDVHLCNAYTLALADTDTVLHGLLRNAALNLPDGQGVVWANRLVHRGCDLPAQRVYGPDLFLGVLDADQASGVRHYLLGGTPQALAALQAEIARRFPGALVVGAESPPFRRLTEQERAAQRERITASRAQVVWLGLGTPKQDREAARLAAELPVVLVAVGAAFDFVSGSKPQAPPWMQNHGLEWLFRLCSEPRRLWRRVLWGHPRFVLAAARGARNRTGR